MTAENSLFSVKMSGKRACLYDSKRQEMTRKRQGDDTGDDIFNFITYNAF